MKIINSKMIIVYEPISLIFRRGSHQEITTALFYPDDDMQSTVLRIILN